MKKVLILIHKLQHYRIPIFNLISENCELTVACDNADDFDASSLRFKTINISIGKIGPFLYHKGVKLHRLCGQYDHVIALLNIRCIDVFSLLFMKRSYALSLWGIGVSGSYTRSFDQTSYVSHLRNYLAKKADSLIFYTDYPVERFISSGYPADKIFIAHNTVENTVELSNQNRNKFIFIGTLYREKGVMELVDQYKLAFDELGGNIYDLNIIGDGELFDELRENILSYGLADKIFLLGAVFDKTILNMNLALSILSFSPTQAGLSVLHSMSVGVPFVTTKHAITGGEIFNIQNGYNGLVLNDISDVSKVMIDSVVDKEKYLLMGINAYNYYNQNRAPKFMAKGILDCIKKGG